MKKYISQHSKMIATLIYSSFLPKILALNFRYASPSNYLKMKKNAHFSKNDKHLNKV